jgi:hypothetical protein
MMKAEKKKDAKNFDFLFTKFNPAKAFQNAVRMSVVNGKKLIIEDAGETLSSSIDSILGK